MVEAAQANGTIDDPLIRQRLMEYYTKIQILRINGLRNLSATLQRIQGHGQSLIARRDEQDVLVGDAPGGDGARARHLRRRRDARRHRPRRPARGRRRRRATSAATAIPSAR